MGREVLVKPVRERERGKEGEMSSAYHISRFSPYRFNVSVPGKTFLFHFTICRLSPFASRPSEQHNVKIQCTVCSSISLHQVLVPCQFRCLDSRTNNNRTRKK